MTKKSKVNKLTETLKSKIKLEFIQGVELDTGDRKVFTIDELIKSHNVASATLYRTARRENWKALREQFDAGKLQHGHVLWALHQTQGKGQRGAIWSVEAKKNLTFSIFFS